MYRKSNFLLLLPIKIYKITLKSRLHEQIWRFFPLLPKWHKTVNLFDKFGNRSISVVFILGSVASSCMAAWHTQSLFSFHCHALKSARGRYMVVSMYHVCIYYCNNRTLWPISETWLNYIIKIKQSWYKDIETQSINWKSLCIEGN